MKKFAISMIVLGVLIVATVACQGKPTETPQATSVPEEPSPTAEPTQEPVAMPPDPVQQAYEWLPNSLHGTTAGKAYWYSSANGGMETLTGIPYENLPCKSCHTLYNKVEDKVGQPRCESCHINQEYAPVQAMVKLPQFPDDGRMQGCLACHGRQRFEWGATKARVDENNQPVLDPVTQAPLTEPVVTDVHRNPAPYGKGIGLTCVNCHGTGDTHGDGNSYNSLIESPNTECTTCHTQETLSQTAGHMIHGENMTCETCHAATVVSCQGCHINGVISGLPEYPHARVTGWKFLLVNEEGKYDLGNIMTAVYTTDTGEVKTFAAVAPFYSHSIQWPQTTEQKVAICASCHASDVIKTYTETGQIVISKWNEEQGKLLFPTKGVIPIVQDYQTAFQVAYPVIGNMEEVLAAKQEGKTLAELEKMTKWQLGKNGVDLWQMLFATPVEKLPPQMPLEAIQAFFPQQP